MFKRKEILTAIDIGSSKISVLIGECDAKGQTFALGLGERESADSVCKGEVRVVEETAKRLGEAIDEASNAAGVEIDSDNIFIAVTNKSIRAQKGTGSVTIMSPDRKIRAEDIAEARKSSQMVPMPVNHSAINFVHSDFLLDGSRKVENPLDQTADRLDAFSFCIFGETNTINNYKRPLEECGYIGSNQEPVFSGIASSAATLVSEDYKHGALLIDIGAGTTEFMLFHGTGYFTCGVIPVGCDHMANDISVGLDLHISRARKILLEVFKTEDFLRAPHIEIEGSVELRKIPSVSVEKIAELRINEIMDIIISKIGISNLKRHVDRGIVICGGGAAFPSVIRCAEKKFDAPVRIGLPREINGAVSKINDPRYACVSGLLKYGSLIKALGKNNKKNILSKIEKKLWGILSVTGRNLRESIKF
jgi:cell division protein FtsA